MSVIAQGFARKLISEVMPTIYKEDGMIFISHKRIDGETIAANLCDALKIQIDHSKLFRDITSVEVGYEAQKEIDESMIKSDAFIFLHTPKSIDSKWIQKELRFTLIRGIPVLWIQIDNADYDKLAVKPLDKPHLSYASSDFDDKAKLSVIVDEIMDKLFEIIMLKSNRVFDYYSALQELFKDKIKQADKDKMIYNIDIERKKVTAIHSVACHAKTQKIPFKNDFLGTF
ncbi:MAG: toll/interleukin-1 receptor domain-containing protein [Ruminococcus sp.]|nr:MAG: toll/interleukin-1 receptor domain-containing protein [Ruminococcus sp.]